MHQTSCFQYVFCDSVLLFQIYYYRRKNPLAGEAITQEIDASEDTPLLDNTGNPKHTSHWTLENQVFKCTLSLIFIFVAGTLAWTIDLTIRGPNIPKEPEGVIEWKSQLLGWISAMLFRTSSTVFNFASCFTHSRCRSSGRSHTTNP